MPETVRPTDSFMKHSDFRLGIEFYTATGKWRCTDVGSRTVIVIELNHPAEVSWCDGRRTLWLRLYSTKAIG